MKFKEGYYYKHKAFRDVCIQVVKVSFACEEYVKMKIDYMIIGHEGDLRRVVRDKKYIVETKDFADWALINQERNK